MSIDKRNDNNYYHIRTLEMRIDATRKLDIDKMKQANNTESHY